MRPLVVVDLETTGLDWFEHNLWEVGAIEYGAVRRLHLWRVKPPLALADEEALAVNRYYERTAGMKYAPEVLATAHDLVTDANYWSGAFALADELAALLKGVTLVAANPVFDASFLREFLRKHDRPAPWHFRVRDICSMAYGYLARTRDPELVADRVAPEIPGPDASTGEFALALGLDLDGYDLHSALGDCQMAADMLDVITRGQP